MARHEGGVSFEPLWRRWPADLETPLSTWLKVGHNQPYSLLLESVEGGEQLGRWSFVASNPLWVLTCRGGNCKLEHRDGRSQCLEGNPFEILRQQLVPYNTEPIPGLPPVGQLFGFWGYELIQWIEPSVPVHPRPPEAPPDGCWMLCDSLLVFDQVRRQITAIAYADLSNGANPDEARANAEQRLQALEEQLQLPLPAGSTPLQWQERNADSLPVASNTSQAAFEFAVCKAREHIGAGDVFQLVLSQQLQTDVAHHPFELYRSLRMVNPSPFMGFFSFNGWYLIGSSPEVMVKAEPQLDGSVKASVRPIAGTRPRGETTEEDLDLEQELLADPKERAEHVMLVDLGRNDLGRVCRPGSVNVQELMVIERYSHVMHIVSQVQGVLREECDVWDLLQASFPAGTVSGAPKIRAMQLIHEMEPGPRGPYSGVYGAMDLGGALNTAITIRTMVVQPNGEGSWRVQVQAGAGVVADSQPTAEYVETLNKAKGLLKALACLEPQRP